LASFIRYSFITEDLLEVLQASFADQIDFDRMSVMGHSVGGHGALMVGLRNTDKFRAVSAFAPMVSPSAVPWGQKAFAKLLGSVDAGAGYDSELIAKNYAAEKTIDVLVDQGTADKVGAS
jgi:S-formylglutathione hydrolase